MTSLQTKNTGREHLDRFLSQLESILKASGVPPKYWLTYLKQQSHQDSRAFDAICEAEHVNIKILGEVPSKASPGEYLHLYAQCVTALRAKRGKPRDQQQRELMSTYYTMCQQRQESVADFAHRLTETQNELEKLLPKIHRTPDADGNAEVELVTAFTVKLREPIAKKLISRDVKYSSLQALISAAERSEFHLLHLSSNKHVEDFSTWESAVNYSGTFPRWPSRP